MKQIEQIGRETPFPSEDYPDQNASRKVIGMAQKRPGSLMMWMDYYLQVTVQGVRSEDVTEKIRLHLQRFQQFFEQQVPQPPPQIPSA